MEHIEHGRIGKLILQAEPHDIKILQRDPRLERGEQDRLLLHPLFKIGPGRKNPFRDRIRDIINDLIKDFKSQVRHPDVIDIGKRKGDLHRSLPVNGIYLTVDIPARPFERGKVHL
jgi:hypothetical protein